MHNKELHIGFLLLDPHLGRGGGENVIENISLGLKSQNIYSYAYMLDHAVHTDFLTHFQKIYIANKHPLLQKIERYLPKFLARITRKLIIKLKVKDISQEITYQQPLDALVILNLSETFNLAYPILQKLLIKLEIPLISWPHGTLSVMKPKTRLKLKKHISLCAAHFAISNGIATELKDIYQQDNTYLIYNPIEIAPIIPRNPNKFIYLGRIGDPIKRVKELLNTLQKLQGNWTLDIYGSAGSKEKDHIFQKYLSSIDPNKKITFHGWKEKPWDHIKEAGILLLNSTNEGFSLVIAEAMMRGIPAVSTDCPVGPNEIIQPGINGWLFDIDNDNECRIILQEIIDKKRQLPDPRIVQASVMKFSLEKVILNFKNSLLKIIENK